MNRTITLLPGDGIGPEIMAEGRRVLDTVATRFGHTFTFHEGLIGGCAIDATGTALPEETLGLCLNSDAVLLAAVGGPKWSDPQAPVRPEQGLLGLRRAMGVFANLRPVVVPDALADASPLRPERVRGVDVLIVRELTGGLYFGTPQGRETVNGERSAVDTMRYNESEIRRVVRLAFELARGRRRKVTSVDKANVLASSRLWREVTHEVAADYPDVECEDILVDACAMYLINRPTDFDVIVTENMFGDILSDEASMIAGSLGMLPSASLGEPGRPGLYEPIHGSAPDIAGRDIANPLATILSAAMMLRSSLGLAEEAAAVEAAVAQALAEGARTADIARPGEPSIGTAEMGARVASRVTIPG
ncbi:MAG: 3-isopropylmalate dehydrogenase [Candidatus Promineofilum sp.]|nr:3-isopropylmalate dehydrogenase [Promineifilum sp.]MBP9657898.1 3-isopropylmalate dehydrogenase [Promineifilum sp.]